MDCINVYFWKSRYFIGGFQKLKIGVPAFGAVYICVVVAALRDHAISVFVNTSAARACCTSYLARFTLRPESRLMTPLMSYSWFCH